MERGLVIKTKRKSCIVLTPGGEYLDIPLPKGGIPRAGQEIQFERRKSAAFLRYLAAAACFLVFIFTGQLYFGQAPMAAAYLTIDINPSIELAVSAGNKVISARGINSDGEKVLSEIKISKRDLCEAVELIIAQAITDQYLGEKDDNVILATLTVSEGKDPVVSLDSIYGAIKNQVESKNVDAEVIIEPVRPEIREEAEQSGISTGRYFLFKQSENKGLPISINEIASTGLGKLEKAKKVTIIELVNGDYSVSNDEKAKGKEKAETRGIYAQRRTLKDDTEDKKDTENISKKQSDKSNIEEQSAKKDKEDKVKQEPRNVHNPKNEGDRLEERNMNRGGNAIRWWNTTGVINRNHRI